MRNTVRGDGNERWDVATLPLKRNYERPTLAPNVCAQGEARDETHIILVISHIEENSGGMNA